MIGKARGFTLIELLVATTAAMFVTIAAYALAKQGSRFFQQEARIANAQYSVTVGFDRLRTDLARTAFLSTPNIQRDPRVCVAPSPGWGSSGLASLGAIRLALGPEGPGDTLNGLAPEQITLSGSYASAELFPVRAVLPSGTGSDVYLQVATGAIARSMGGQLTDDNLGNIFKAGRMLRLLEPSTGRYDFGVIASAGLGTDGNPIVRLAAAPAIPYKRQGNPCGIEGLGVGTQASVISWIRYELRQLDASTPGYGPLFSGMPAGVGDDTRRELVREELTAALQPMAGTLEIVADYAVDLRFAFTAITAPSTNPALARYAFGAEFNRTLAADVATLAGSSQSPGPEWIRSIQTRLAVRSREVDRQVQVSSVTAPAGNLFRYELPDSLGFARARTITSEVNLPNLAGLSW